MIVSLLSKLSESKIYYKIPDFLDKVDLYLKIEGLNIARSIKLKTAIYLLNGLEKDRAISPKTHTIIESSSGNLGVALSILCKERGYSFVCVTDPNISKQNESLMRCYGATLIKVQARDKNGGYLQTRIDYIKKRIAQDKSYIWTNQYENRDNIIAHYETTAQEILSEMKEVDYLFIGAGTTGTLMGCLRYFKKYSPNTIVVAVDAEGSVTFGHPSKKRYIPGIGTSLKPPISALEEVENLMMIDEVSTIKTAHFMRQNYGLLLGGSSCSVIAALKKYTFSAEKKINVVVVCPDLGENYLETIYNPVWVKEKFNISIEDPS